jgi:hypothetical protein
MERYLGEYRRVSWPLHRKYAGRFGGALSGVTGERMECEHCNDNVWAAIKRPRGVSILDFDRTVLCEGALTIGPDAKLGCAGCKGPFIFSFTRPL